MAFEELKERQSVMWGNGGYDPVSATLTDIHELVGERLQPKPGERWLDLATGTGRVAELFAATGATVVGVDWRRASSSRLGRAPPSRASRSITRSGIVSGWTASTTPPSTASRLWWGSCSLPTTQRPPRNSRGSSSPVEDSASRTGATKEASAISSG